MKIEPGYLHLYHSGTLHERAEALCSFYSACRVCPRNCGIDRLAGELGGCHSGAQAAVASYTVHKGEEPPISGTNGSGTIFFANCNLRCVYCQNHQISQLRRGAEALRVSAQKLAGMMLELQRQNCHNINFVSPTHFVPSMIEALELAIEGGLHIPLVYNSNGYDSVEVLRLLEGIIDIYLPDLKYADERTGRRLSKVANYPEVARAAILEMHRQVGHLTCDEHGIAQRGLLIRHLVLPEELSRSLESLRWIRQHLSEDVYLSVMAQYYPANKAEEIPPLHRKLRFREYEKVTDALEDLHLLNGWVQSHEDAPDYYRPDFDNAKPFEE